MSVEREIVDAFEKHNELLSQIIDALWSFNKIFDINNETLLIKCKEDTYEIKKVRKTTK